MSLDTALSGALSSLRAVQQQISLVSNNINNASTPGYTKKTANLAPIGDGVNLVGVIINDYARAADKTLLKQLNASAAENGMKSTQSYYLSQIQDILGSSSDTVRLTDNLEAFVSAWRQMQAEPENTALQSQVISSGNSFTTTVRTLASKIEQLDRAISTDTQTAVGEMNDALRAIVKSNSQIAQALASGMPTGDYEDQRDLALQKLAQYVDIRTFERGNGQLAVYTPYGYGLLDGDAQSFAYDGHHITVTGSVVPVDQNLKGGKLEALLGLRADSSPAAANPDATQEIIRKMREQLDTLVSGFLNATTGPDSFAQAYDSAASNSGALAAGFFVGTARSDFSVNTSLLDGSATVKRQAAIDVAEAMKTDTRSFTAYGQTAGNLSYTGYAEEIVALWQAAANRAAAEAETAKGQNDYFKKVFTDTTSVSVDEELISLQTLQRSYQAAARLASVVQQLNQVISDMVR